MTTTKGELLKAIHDHCLECCGGSSTWVQTCPESESCKLWSYRLGRNQTPVSEVKQLQGRRLAEQRKRMKDEKTRTGT